jgi:hypothetical protein
LEGFSMPLLLLNDRHTTERKNESRKRIAAAEACRVPKQSSNDEGRPQDLQIGAGKIAPLPSFDRRLSSQEQPTTVDIQDNPASISYYQAPPPELKWDKERRGPAPSRSRE